MNSVIDADDSPAVDIASRVDACEWPRISADLDAHGWALLPAFLTASECAAIATLYADDNTFRSHVLMARHGFGRGEYKYFAYPLPQTVGELRTALYSRLLARPQGWDDQLGIAARPPRRHTHT